MISQQNNVQLIKKYMDIKNCIVKLRMLNLMNKSISVACMHMYIQIFSKLNKDIDQPVNFTYVLQIVHLICQSFPLVAELSITC